MPLLGVKGVRAAGYAILAARNNKDDVGDEPSQGSEPVGELNPQASRGLEPHRRDRPILPDAYPEENPVSVPGFSRTNSYSSSHYNVTWGQSTQSYIPQGQYPPPTPNPNGHFPSRPGHSAQYPDPYQDYHQLAGPLNNHVDFSNQLPYGVASQQPSGHHQYPNQGFAYNQDLPGDPIQHRNYQQHYDNQWQSRHQDHQQQTFQGQGQETISQVHTQTQHAFYPVPDTLRRASTTPVPDTNNTCRHGTSNDSSCERCTYENMLQRRYTGF